MPSEAREAPQGRAPAREPRERVGWIVERHAHEAGRGRRRDHRQVPAVAVGPASAAPPGPGRAGLRLRRRHRLLRPPPRPDRGRGERGGELLHDVQALPGRRVPRGRVHQHAVRRHGRRPDPRQPARAPRRGRRRAHRRRQGQPGARRVQRRLRLCAGGHGELGILRQHDPGLRAQAGRRPAGGRAGRAHARRTAAGHLEAGGPDPGRVPRRPGHRREHRGRAHAGGPAHRQGTRLDAGRRERGMTSVLVPTLTARWDEPDSFTLEAYRRAGGYQALPQALGMDQDEVIQAVKDSGLRGRGGAGFPTGVKWGFIPQGDGKPHYLVVNADESEPGTCKDIPLMLATPHAMVEGAVIAAYAIGAGHAFIYVRGEVLHVIRRVHHAVKEAYEAGYLGENILGSGFSLEVIVHAGAGAYECGEETALLDSLEGRRGQPRLKPPFPAIAGLYACPTVVNNVESIASVPYIIQHGAARFAALGTERSKGFGIFSLTGHVTTPGQYEAPLGVTLRELLEEAGGVRAGHTLKFWTPGGSSTPIFTDEHLDVPLDL